MDEAFNPREKNIAVLFGDETFPKSGRGRSNKHFSAAVAKLTKVLKDLNIRRVYLPSYKGTNMTAAIILTKLNIPYTLVIPHPSFGSMSTIRDKLGLAAASSSADKTIVFSGDDTSGLVYPAQEITEDFVEYITRHCNSVIVAHSKKPTEKFLKLLSNFGENAFEKHFSFIY